MKPFEDFFHVATDNGLCTGKGAWELAARWSYLELNDKNIEGGRPSDVTIGVNWYYNNRMRFMANYVRGLLDDPVDRESVAEVFQFRLQLGF